MKLSPLAYRMRPKTIDEFVGQEHLLSKGLPLREMIDKKEIFSSLIFWGPPGCGKTTLARIIANSINAEFHELSAVSASKSDIDKIVNSKQSNYLIQSFTKDKKKKILFLDEIHRFNKAQQDFLLPFVERGDIILIGATTENPSFEVISALLSRTRVFTLKELTNKDIINILNQALSNKEKGLGSENILITGENKSLIAHLSNGDARSALNILELSFLASKSLGNKEILRETILNSAERKLRYDKNGEEHYNVISALHKSMRDSDVQASIYWTMRMIEAGEDPKYIIRRMIRFASEDIGNADPKALQLAVSAKEAVMFLGYPECNTALVQTAIYLAQAPKSNKVYSAVLKAKDVINQTGNLPVPLILRNPETSLMKELGYGKGYKYAPDSSKEEISNQQHLPPEVDKIQFYSPTEKGFEKVIKKRMEN